jgi:hypothetical protein
MLFDRMLFEVLLPKAGDVKQARFWRTCFPGAQILCQQAQPGNKDSLKLPDALLLRRLPISSGSG